MTFSRRLGAGEREVIRPFGDCWTLALRRLGFQKTLQPVGTYGGQVMDGVSAQGQLTVVRGSSILSMVISLVLECKIGIDPQQLAESLPSVPGE